MSATVGPTIAPPDEPVGDPLSAVGSSIEAGPGLSRRPDVDLRQAARRGVVLTAAVALVAELIGVVNSLVVARFLQPADYALLGIAMMALTLGIVVRDLRISTRLIQMPLDPGLAFDAGFTLEVRLSLAYLVVAAGTAPLLAYVYHDRAVLPVLFALSAIGFFPAAMMPAAQIQRNLDWWRQRIVDAVGPLVGVAVTLPLAVAGAGVWALVAGQLASMGAQVAVLWIRAPRRPRLLRRLPPGSLRFFLSFGIPLWAAGMVAALAVNLLVYSVTVTLGLAALGYFRVAATLGDRIDRAEQLLTSVLFPILCRLGDQERLRRAFVLSNRLILLWAVPAGVGLAVFAPEITHLVLGGSWESGTQGSGVTSLVPLLRVEGLGEVLNAIATSWALYYQVVGRTRAVLPMTVCIWTSMAGGSAILCHLYGYDGLVATLFMTALLGVLLRRHQMRRLFPGISVLRSSLPLLAAGAVAAAAALAMARPVGGFGLGAVGARVAVFLAVYTIVALPLERGTIREALRIARAPRLPEEPAEPGAAGS